MLIEAGDLYRIVMYGVLIIAVPIILAMLAIVLFRLNSILKDFQVVSNSMSELTENKEDFQNFTQDVLSHTANNVIETQTENVAKNIVKTVMDLVIK